MSPIMDRVIHLRSRVDEAWRVLDLDAVKHEIAALEVEASSPDFWSDQERARRESQKLADLKEQYDRWAALRASTVELQELLELAEAEKDVSLSRDAESRVSELEKTYLSLEFSMLFSGAHDASNAVLAIHAGAGGTDAQDWAEMLMRMYFRYCEKNGWKTQIITISEGQEAGIKSVTF